MADNHGNDIETIEMVDQNENAPPVEVDDVRIDDDKNNKRDSNKVTDYKDEAMRLRKWLRLSLNSAFKYETKHWDFNRFYCLVFLVQIIKLVLLTSQMLHFGKDRGNFSSIVNRGDIVLRHLLLENWDASWETLPYPPSKGEFAVYTIDGLESAINYAVKNYYNVERKAIGYYVRTADDKMKATMKYFDFPEFHGASTGEGITISEITFPIDKGLTAEVTHKNETIYSYNITREFDHHNVTQAIKRMLSTTLQFKLHSVRSHESSRKATCLLIEGSVKFVDLDNNGQVLVDLDTRSSRIKCKDMNLSVSDWQLENTLKDNGYSVIALCGVSSLFTIISYIFSCIAGWRTKQFMKRHYRAYFGMEDNDKKDLPALQYAVFWLRLWDLIVLLSDAITINGTYWIVFNTVQSELELELLDSHTVGLGFGCILAWLSMLRFFKINKKLDLLFSTLHKACLDVIAYLICVGVLFCGFLFCGYVVMGPYHVKFKTLEAAAETLFSVVYGDEIYTTLAILESDKSGGNWVWWFSKSYLAAYVTIFTIVVINLLIALFISAYESIKTYNNDKPDALVEALGQVLIQDGEGSNLRRSIYDFVNISTPSTHQVNSLRTELVRLKPRTLKVFMEDEGQKIKTCKSGCLSCSFISPFFCDDKNTTVDEPEQEDVYYNTKM